MMLLRKDGLDLIAIPQPGHARVGQRALRSADALRRGLPRRRAARHRQQASPDTIEHNRLLIAALDENCSAPPS
jgi:hypothetical protein